ncbi:gamma-butyrobetaine hydroxylase-like domain-containing protein [Paraburkholderia sp. D1E]|uniref:gamma-butyrobetaine hydroxylase-like domain-containing protein n=1 Tax=Paraburkholderia sp. D1E TaxID=3461398 RepID=UPI004045370D
MKILDEGKAVSLTFRGGRERRFHAIWLRDNARDESTRAPGNGQRLITLGEISADVRIAAASVDERTLRVTFQPDGREIVYDIHWLAEHAYDGVSSRAPSWVSTEIETWDAGLGQRVPCADFSTVSRTDGALGDWLYDIRRFGFAKLTGGPVKIGALLEVVALFGYVRETNYGKVFEVRTEVNRNVAKCKCDARGRTRQTGRRPPHSPAEEAMHRLIDLSHELSYEALESSFIPTVSI